MRAGHRVAVLSGIPLLLVSVAACSVHRGAEREWAVALRVGQCADLRPGEPTATEITVVHPIPCEEAHLMEVYARPEYRDPAATGTEAGTEPGAAATSGPEYPGQAPLQAFARESCAGAFRSYLGRNPRRAEHSLTYLYPSVASWTAADGRPLDLGLLNRLVKSAPQADRSVVCVVTRKDGRDLVGSVRGAPYATPPTAPAEPSPAPPTTRAKA